MSNTETLSGLFTSLSSFKGYSAAERRAMKRDSERLARIREANLRASGFASEEEREAAMWAECGA